MYERILRKMSGLYIFCVTCELYEQGFVGYMSRGSWVIRAGVRGLYEQGFVGYMSRGSWVVRAEVRSPAEPKFFSLQQNVETVSGFNSAPIKMETWLFPRVKQPGCDIDHSPPSIAEVKNER